ncbi:MAG: bifunctional proline dehydrogenase/L-glutamate gamma-semialdehyde dehydrogenase [Acidimicrobiales bacterium]
MPDSPTGRDRLLVDEAVELAGHWLAQAAAALPRPEDGPSRTLQEMIDDPAAVPFTMGFVDRVIRPDTPAVAAHQLAVLVGSHRLPRFLSWWDRAQLKAGALLGPRLPRLVIPMARHRLRQLVGHLVVDAEPAALAAHLAERRRQGFSQNINLLGEAVLGEREAARRLAAVADLIDRPDVDYVSVKISSVASQLNHWDWDGSLDRVSDRLRLLLRRAAATDPPTFVNLDMEEYRDLELTLAAFKRVLSEPEAAHQPAGIVLQAYLPDSFAALRDLVTWAAARQEAGGGEIKVRLVKGANLAMERVDATLHGWQPAPYATKAEVDANFKRCLDWVLRPARTRGVRLGVASHNLFDVAWAHLLARHRGVADRVELEMLQGMAPALARAVQRGAAQPDSAVQRGAAQPDSAVLGATTGAGERPVLLYTPIVSDTDFDVAISYLFRRLDETAAPGNFLRSLGHLRPGNAAFAQEAERFGRAVSDRWEVAARPRRSQHRPALAAAAADADHGTEATTPAAGGPPLFVNEPDTDPVLAANRAWMAAAIAPQEAGGAGPAETPVTTSTAAIDAVITRARTAGPAWAATAAPARRKLLHAVADELARQRGPLIAAMVHEGGKTVAEADTEVSEAVDFARWYGDRAPELEDRPGVRFVPLGVVAVVPPWNFPVAIPAGGLLAALAAGNTAILKPAPETPRCAELVARCCWEAGVSPDVLQFVRTPDDEVGRRLVTGADGVILTGSIETARLFQSWKPDLALFAETSGKNAIVITPNADLDLAVADLVRSAFGHAGQKCSAASLAICVGEVYRSPRFRRQLADAVESLVVGPAADLGSMVGPLIAPPGPKLARGLTTLDNGEEWLVEPRPLDADRRLWRPGVRLGVRPGSWFHQTECFGPVLGLMAARDLDDAIALQNGVPFGLTGGIHSLDPTEVARWTERVEVGNAYVNRSVTGAIVARQPFGGWKQSSVGPGAKAGGPNYVAQLGRWHLDRPGDDTAEQFLADAAASDRQWWRDEYSVARDWAGLWCESNLFRYRPLPVVAIRVGPGSSSLAVTRVLRAAEVCGVPTLVSRAETESDDAFLGRLGLQGVTRVRALGEVSETLRRGAAARGVHLADDPVTADGYLELRHYVREQAVSRTTHRFGTVIH